MGHVVAPKFEHALPSLQTSDRAQTHTASVNPPASPSVVDIRAVWDAQTHPCVCPAPRAPMQPTWWQSIAAAPTRRALHRQAACDALPGAMWAERLDAFDAHAAELTLHQTMQWLVQQGVDYVHYPRHWLSTALFPGQYLWAPYRALMPLDAAHLTLTPQCCITTDHAVLDGVVVRHTQPSQPPAAASAPRAPIVVVPGNAMRWEDCQMWLAELAERTGREVLMFNYRKMGASIGTACNTNTAIYDAQAALLHGQTLSSGSKLSVVAISMGGGASAAAIDALKRADVIKHADIAHWVGIHTFGSLDCLVGARWGAWPARLSRFGFGVLGLNFFDAQGTLALGPLAQAMCVLNAEHDALIAPAAVLTLPQPLPASWHKKLAYTRTTYAAGRRHGDLQGALEAGGWADLLASEQMTSLA